MMREGAYDLPINYIEYCPEEPGSLIVHHYAQRRRNMRLDHEGPSRRCHKVLVQNMSYFESQTAGARVLNFGCTWARDRSMRIRVWLKVGFFGVSTEGRCASLPPFRSRRKSFCNAPFDDFKTNPIRKPHEKGL